MEQSDRKGRVEKRERKGRVEKRERKGRVEQRERKGRVEQREEGASGAEGEKGASGAERGRGEWSRGIGRRERKGRVEQRERKGCKVPKLVQIAMLCSLACYHGAGPVGQGAKGKAPNATAWVQAPHPDTHALLAPPPLYSRHMSLRPIPSSSLPHTWSLNAQLFTLQKDQCLSHQYRACIQQH
ncbi:hypothetical protein XELAEV_18019872mg [Xenopus laevis]|uniref:Uncharacterized protein n=1 Tax=Xenopus laevis TaxID=8355 RepID=A0A974HQG2_XENLA|nr:hypothetical protein XELAEV_18019872mg [Xenopus laevis]